ncbi:short-subunit dehydrogenase [Halopolyspora algeriensis]|uniref:Short-subunit dehydrogenase n=1 Tax=Halopolyspora algeriensis TaxID=1500506 RepID=A0A368VE43_9ACTN|nr:SDR family oxidoreductase [Halopolyspora algeriensis]RCW39537.1 short-subunit dehydrogenase [Halopolyspora algeriensis]TQM56150.1 short-subunit dehydrogenase [Halopolyspora algeriensis]
MDSLADAVVVITGAGNGIGAAMSRKFAARGATVVVNDLDADAARRVATEVGGLAVPGDAAADEGVRALVDTALGQYGRIDLFCANAGVATAGGPETSDELWDRTWEINVMAHVRAARAVLPHWLERGSGHFLATVSAAGLLTMLGSAPYSVTKHAALGFAEWMSVTYADRGVTVQALCPQGVRTDMLEGSGEAGQRLLAAEAIEPEQVADTVVDALGDERFLVLPHAEVAQRYAQRAADPDRWQAGMRKLQRGLEQ